MLYSLIEKLRRLLYKTKRRTGLIDIEKLVSHSPLRLNLGCGSEHMNGWVNIDVSANTVADFLMDFKELKNIFKPASVDEIMMIHSISYLRLWEAQDLFGDVYSLLKFGGKYILEFPDIVKCSAHLLKHENNIEEYLEGVRGIYAFGIHQIARKENFYTYAFGWSSWHIKHELLHAGFVSVEIRDPETHNQLLWRDTRIEAIK